MPTVHSTGANGAREKGFKAVVVVAASDAAPDESLRYCVADEFDSYADALLAGRRFASELIETLP